MQCRHHAVPSPCRHHAVPSPPQHAHMDVNNMFTQLQTQVPAQAEVQAPALAHESAVLAHQVHDLRMALRKHVHACVRQYRAIYIGACTPTASLFPHATAPLTPQ